MSIKSLIRKGCANRYIAPLLHVNGPTVRYHRKREAEQATDGRARQPFVASSYAEAIAAYLEATREKRMSLTY